MCLSTSSSKFVIIFFCLYGAILFIWFIFSNRKKRETLERLKSYLPGTIPKFSFYLAYNGVYQGLKFSVVLVPGGRNTPPYLKIVLLKNSTFKLKIYRETTLSEIGKKIGVVREVKVFDENFDKDFLILSNKPERAASYFGSSEMKSAVRELFDSGFNGLLIDRKALTIQKPNYNLNIDLEPQRIVSALQKLSLLARGV